MTQYVLGYVTAASLKEAKKIGKALVTEKLAACVNIIKGMESIYQWEGKIESGHEIVLILKSRAPLKPRITKRIKELHSYTCPCIVFLPINSGNPQFLKWIHQETI